MSEFVYAGQTEQTVDIFLQDSSSSVGAGLAGLVHNSAGLVASYRKGATGSRVAITLATQTVGGAYSSGGFVEIDATNMKGVYRLDLPNAMVDAEGFVTLYIYGATNLLATALRIDCRPIAADSKRWNGLTTVALPLVPTTAGRTLDVSAGGEAGIDWANVGSPTTTLTLIGTTIKTATDVETDTADIQSRLPAALVSGRIDASVGAMAANTLTASALATDAVTEIQSGLALATDLATLAGYVDTEVAAIKAKTDNLPSDPADASDIAASFVTVNSKLDTIDDFLDTEVAAIKTVTDNIATMYVLDGAVYQYTANALELGPGGSSTSITVVPLTGVVEGRVDGTTINVFTQETCTVSIAVVDAEGNAVTVTGLTLEIVIESRLMTDVVVIANGSITKSGSTISFAIPSSVSATEGAYQWALRKTNDDSVLLQGPLIVSYAPQGD
jgi:hypothetical protein